MNRETLLTAVSKATSWSKKDVEQILLASLDQIMEALRRGEEVALVGFGQFTVRTRKSRRGVNPRSPHESVTIPSVKVVKFQAGKRLKEAVRGE